ncbi:hypothetical protein DFH06DRAFT_1297460 [Mycena polygramma]|nr:hypothetical protein DFH06DRAFT_1297460 [Mycena polygramma]
MPIYFIAEDQGRYGLVQMIQNTLESLIDHVSILLEVIWRRNELKRPRPFFFATTVYHSTLDSAFGVGWTWTMDETVTAIDVGCGCVEDLRRLMAQVRQIRHKREKVRRKQPGNRRTVQVRQAEVQHRASTWTSAKMDFLPSLVKVNQLRDPISFYLPPSSPALPTFWAVPEICSQPKPKVINLLLPQAWMERWQCLPTLPAAQVAGGLQAGEAVAVSVGYRHAAGARPIGSRLQQPVRFIVHVALSPAKCAYSSSIASIRGSDFSPPRSTIPSCWRRKNVGFRSNGSYGTWLRSYVSLNVTWMSAKKLVFRSPLAASRSTAAPRAIPIPAPLLAVANATLMRVVELVSNLTQQCKVTGGCKLPACDESHRASHFSQRGLGTAQTQMVDVENVAVADNFGGVNPGYWAPGGQNPGELVLAASSRRVSPRRFPALTVTFTRPRGKLAMQAASSDEDAQFDCQIWHPTNLLRMPTKILITTTSYEVTNPKLGSATSKLAGVDLGQFLTITLSLSCEMDRQDTESMPQLTPRCQSA